MNDKRFTRRQFLRHSTAAGALLLSAPLLPAATAAAKRTATDQVTLGNTGIQLSRLGMGTGSNGGHTQFELGQQTFTDLVHSVDFPKFVGDLLKAVFDANLKVMKQQTDTYIKLMKEATKSASDGMQSMY